MDEEEYRYPWRDAFRSLWFLPTVFIVGALTSGYFLSRIVIDSDSPLAALVFQGDASAARELLIVVSGTMITVTSLVFVLTVVALQIASTQFSPRLLRSFLEDPGTRLVLSVFVSTFAYSLGGLFTVGQVDGSGQPFVPRLAVTGSLGLALTSVGMLIYYIQHITNAIRIDTVMLGVRHSTMRALQAHYPNRLGEQARLIDPPSPAADSVALTIGRSGYVQKVDVDRLSSAARATGVTIRMRTQVGHHLVTGSTVGWAWSLSGSPFDGDQLVGQVRSAMTLTGERTVDRDVVFGIRQLVDIAIKGVAPSVNDPYTAVQAIQHLSVIMRALSEAATDDVVVAEGDKVLVYVPVTDFTLALDTICSNIRRSASDRPRVIIELLRLLETVATSNTSLERRAFVDQQLDILLDEVKGEIVQPADIAPILTLVDEVRFATAHGRVSGP